MQVNNEYNFVSSAVQDLPPWRPEAKRRPRPHWMRDLPPRLDLASVEHCLPGKVIIVISGCVIIVISGCVIIVISGCVIIVISGCVI